MKNKFELLVRGRRLPIKAQSINENPELFVDLEILDDLSEKQIARLKKARKTILIQRMLPIDWDKEHR